MEHIKHYKTVVNPNWNVQGHPDFKSYRDVLILCKETYNKLTNEQKKELGEGKAPAIQADDQAVASKKAKTLH